MTFRIDLGHDKENISLRHFIDILKMPSQNVKILYECFYNSLYLTYFKNVKKVWSTKFNKQEIIRMNGIFEQTFHSTVL